MYLCVTLHLQVCPHVSVSCGWVFLYVVICQRVFLRTAYVCTMVPVCDLAVNLWLGLGVRVCQCVFLSWY